MTSAKSILRLTIKNEMQKLTDQLSLGVRIKSVELTDVSPPLEVNSAFQAVSNARVKKQEIIKDVEEYANSTIPRSRGTAARIILDANAYADELTNDSKARTAAFESLLSEYNKNPKVFKQQRFAETFITISKKSKISISNNAADTTFYLSNTGDATQSSSKSKSTALENPDINVIRID